MVVPVLHAKVQRDIDHSKLPTATAITFIFRAIYMYIYIYQPENMRLGISHFPWNNSVTDCCWKWNICRGNQIKFIFKWQCLRKGAFVKICAWQLELAVLMGTSDAAQICHLSQRKEKKKKKATFHTCNFNIVIGNWKLKWAGIWMKNENQNKNKV